MKSFKKRIEQMKGITLVGLVITIILLLILAGVAINLAIGEKGIFNQSKLAAEKYKDAQNNEEEQLQIATNAMLGNISGNRDENGNSSISNNYSTNEQVIGTWIDGKPLYRKVITGLKSPSKVDTWENLYTEENAEMLMVEKGFFYTEDGKFELNYSSGSGLLFRVNENSVKTYALNVSHYCNRNVEIIINYTKTTDTVSSATE